MKKTILLFLGMVILSVATSLACTNFIVGKAASADGSVIVSYSADSYGMYGYLAHFPAAVHPEGAMRDVYEWDTNKHLGQIPEAPVTYNVIGNMNEWQVTIGETTNGGREECWEGPGVIDYGSLIYIALQRARTAREAVLIMTSLVKEHGYVSEGETFSIADPNEAWIMEMIGKGKEEKGAVWVALRLPDDVICAHANQARVRQFPLDDPENCLYAEDVITFARKKGWYNGADKDFSFADVYNPLTFDGLRFCDARVWSFFNLYADADMSKWLPSAKGDVKAEPIPLYFKPKHKISVQDVQKAMRDHYEGTDLDMTGDLGAGAWSMPYRLRPLTYKVDGKDYFNERTISTFQTGFTFVGQMRSWLPREIGGVLWFGNDDANTSVYTPVYCSITEAPACYSVEAGDAVTFSFESAFWMFNWVSNMVYMRYSMMIDDLRKVQTSLEESFFASQKEVEKEALSIFKANPSAAVAYLTKYSACTADKTMKDWMTLAQKLIVKYNDCVIKPENEDGTFKRTETGLGERVITPGYPEDFNRRVVKETKKRYQVPASKK
ncbi:MAG: C69 family dipeptidase [Bacteroidaceae bacterium]|nr:C69 family dipeptidase [Bacteroidaceae bacterium]